MCLSSREVGPSPSFIVRVSANVRESVERHRLPWDPAASGTLAAHRRKDVPMHPSAWFVGLARTPTFSESNRRVVGALPRPSSCSAVKYIERIISRTYIEYLWSIQEIMRRVVWAFNIHVLKNMGCLRSEGCKYFWRIVQPNSFRPSPIYHDKSTWFWTFEPCDGDTLQVCAPSLRDARGCREFEKVCCPRTARTVCNRLTIRRRVETNRAQE